MPTHRSAWAKSLLTVSEVDAQRQSDFATLRLLHPNRGTKVMSDPNRIEWLTREFWQFFAVAFVVAVVVCVILARLVFG